MEDIVILFTQQHGIFQKYFKFETIIFFILVIVIFSRFLGKNYMSIVILIAFGLYITNLYVKVNNTHINDYNKNTLLKLESLQETTYAFIQYKEILIDNFASVIYKSELAKCYKRIFLEPTAQ